MLFPLSLDHCLLTASESLSNIYLDQPVSSRRLSLLPWNPSLHGNTVTSIFPNFIEGDLFRQTWRIPEIEEWLQCLHTGGEILKQYANNSGLAKQRWENKAVINHLSLGVLPPVLLFIAMVTVCVLRNAYPSYLHREEVAVYFIWTFSYIVPTVLILGFTTSIVIKLKMTGRRSHCVVSWVYICQVSRLLSVCIRFDVLSWLYQF